MQWELFFLNVLRCGSLYGFLAGILGVIEGHRFRGNLFSCNELTCSDRVSSLSSGTPFRAKCSKRLPRSGNRLAQSAPWELESFLQDYAFRGLLLEDVENNVVTRQSQIIGPPA